MLDPAEIGTGAAHPPEFWRHVAETGRAQAAGPGCISASVARQAGRALGAARARRALSEERVSFWAEQVITAGSDERARELIASIDSLAGRDGPGPGPAAAEFEAETEGLEALLYPPPPGREREWALLAASAQARIDADVAAAEAEDYSHLWPAAAPGEADRRIAASRRPPQAGADDLDEAEYAELAAAIFPQSGRHAWPVTQP